MDIITVRTFFMWCTIINGVGLIIFFLFIACAGGWIHKVHSKFFPIPRETFNTVMYSFIGAYKIFIFGFNLVPFIALSIVG